MVMAGRGSPAFRTLAVRFLSLRPAYDLSADRSVFALSEPTQPGPTKILKEQSWI
jgi:hypothetical protein